MAQVVEGVIEKIHTKTGQGKRGPWTKYSAVIGGDWYSFGFNNPNMNEGDNVKAEYEEGQYGKDVKRHKVVSSAPPAPTSAAVSAPGGRAPAANVGMAWGNASNVAANLICKMAEIDALPLSAANSKANKAKRFDEFMELFNKVRVELYEDSLDIQRVLDRVADAGAVEDNTPPELPDVQEEEDAEEF